MGQQNVQAEEVYCHVLIRVGPNEEPPATAAPSPEPPCIPTPVMELEADNSTPNGKDGGQTNLPYFRKNTVVTLLIFLPYFVGFTSVAPQRAICSGMHYTCPDGPATTVSAIIYSKPPDNGIS